MPSRLEHQTFRKYRNQLIPLGPSAICRLLQLPHIVKIFQIKSLFNPCHAGVCFRFFSIWIQISKCPTIHTKLLIKFLFTNKLAPVLKTMFHQCGLSYTCSLSLTLMALLNEPIIPPVWLIMNQSSSRSYDKWLDSLFENSNRQKSPWGYNMSSM